MRTVALLLCAAMASSASFADVVVLRNGGLLEGIVHPEDDVLVLETGLGTVRIPYDQVHVVHPGPSPLDHFRARFQKIKDSRRAEDFFELAQWARDHGLSRHISALLDRVLELEPEHEGARRMLGYTHHLGRWMTQDEYRHALGEVWFRGRWMPSAECSAIQSAEARAREAAEMQMAEQRAATMLAAPPPPWSCALGFFPTETQREFRSRLASTAREVRIRREKTLDQPTQSTP